MNHKLLKIFLGLSLLLCALPPAVAQNFSVSYNGAQIVKVLSDLEQRTDYTFVYQKQELSDIAPLSISMDNATLDQVLDRICSETGLTYKKVNKTIVLRKGEAPSQPDSRRLRVSGVVRDAAGTPIPFASVVLKGTMTGISSDENGAYTLDPVPANATLVFSSIGYKNLEVAVAGRSRIDATLAASAESLEETIVVAYGTAKKGSLTGSAAVIQSEDLEKRITSNITKAFDGQVPGIISTSGTGQPGEGASIVIRGYGSINASRTPLYVVDGIPFDGGLSSINPQDIESMTVLKDASSGALYGARGANGVVMITTKKGAADKVNINYSGNFGWANPGLKYYDRVNSKDFVQLTFESLRTNFYDSGSYSWEEASQKARETLGGTLGGEIYNPFKKYTWETIIGADGYVQADAVPAWEEDWLDDGAVRHNAFRQEHVVSVSGGTKKLRSFMSLGYTNENGYIVQTGFQRYSGRAKIDAQPNDFIAAGINLSLSDTEHIGVRPEGDDTGNPIIYAQQIGPLYPVYEKDLNGNDVLDENGNRIIDYGDTRPWDPGSSVIGRLYDDSTDYSYINAGIRTYLTLGSDSDKAGILKGLKLTVNFGGDDRDLHEYAYNNMTHGGYKTANGRLRRYATRKVSYTLNELLTWNRNFGKHGFDLLAGHEFYNYKFLYLYGIRTNLVEGIKELRPATESINNDSYSQNYAIESWLSRFNYNFDEKYYFSASFRRDGSSRFNKNYRWGNFWSVGANWRVSKEPWMQAIDWINNMNLKVSYGVQGNDDLDTYYAWQSLYNLSYPNDGKTGAVVESLENTNISWEKNANFNTGFDVSLFNNRLNIGVEWYSRVTRDMLLNYPMALSTGFSGYDANVGSMRNRGLEWTVGGVIMDRKNFFWKTTFTGATIRNKILSLTEGTTSYTSGQRIVEVGRPIYTYYMVKHAGVDPETGNELFWTYDSIDENGNYVNETTTSDYATATAHKYYFDTRIPKVSGSLGMEFEFFKCFDFSFLTTYSLGGVVYDVIYNALIHGGYGRAMSPDLLARWQKPGDVTDVPKMDIAKATGYTSNRALIDASYFSVKNITLGYTVPTVAARHLGASKIRVYATLDNYFFFNHLHGMNPQYNFAGYTSQVIAPQKTAVLGINLTF